jgi:hypothetical protein
MELQIYPKLLFFFRYLHMPALPLVLGVSGGFFAPERKNELFNQLMV